MEWHTFCILVDTVFSRTCPGSSRDIRCVVCNTLVKVQVLSIVPIVCSDDSASSTVSGTGSERTGTDEVDAVSLRVRLYQDLPIGYCSTHNTHYFFIGFPRSGCVGGLNTAHGASSGGGECTSSASLMMLSTYNFVTF